MALVEVLSPGRGGGIVGSVIRSDVPLRSMAVASAAARMAVTEVLGMMGAAASYFWSFLLDRARREERGRRIAGRGQPTPPSPVADEDGERR